MGDHLWRMDNDREIYAGRVVTLRLKYLPQPDGRRHLREDAVAHDEEEEIELVRLPLEQAIRQVTEGEISDAKTVAGLLAYAHRASVRDRVTASDP